MQQEAFARRKQLVARIHGMEQVQFLALAHQHLRAHLDPLARQHLVQMADMSLELN